MKTGVHAHEGGIRALLLADSFLPHAGGSRVYYYQLYRNWRPDQVTVLTKKVSGWEEFDRLHSSEHFRILRRFRPLRSAKYTELPKAVLPTIQAVVRALGSPVDVVACGDLFPQGPIAMLLKQVFGLPFLVHCHGDDFLQAGRFPRQARMRNRVYRSAEMIVANSEFTRRLLLGIGISDRRIRIVTPGVDCGEFAPRKDDGGLAARLGLQNAGLQNAGLQNAMVLLTVARLVPRKGHDMVLRAVARLAGEFPRLRYLIVGGGPEEARLRQMAAELGISERCIFAGYVPQQELPEYYRLGDVMVMPNRDENGDSEGFGMTFLEASAAGKPVIGGRSGGAIEAIEDGVTGMLVSPDDLDELAAAIRNLLAHPHLAEAMGAAGMQRAREQFDWSLRSEQLRAIARAIATPRGTKRFANGTECDCGLRD